MRLDVFHHFDDPPSDVTARILRKLDQLLAQGRTIVADFTALTAEVAAVTDAEQSAIALINGISQQITDALAAADAGDTAALAQVVSDLEASRAQLAAAVAANTPAAPPA